MPVPSLVKTWQHSANNAVSALGSALANNRRILRSIKNALLAMASGAPTIRYSCSSTVAGAAGDGVDRWAADSDLVWANAGSAHSWIVLQFAGIAAGFQVLISCEGVSAAGNNLTVVVSPSAGFTGGTTTARPTATDENVIHNGAFWTNLSTDVAARWSVQMPTDGSAMRWLVFSGGSLASFFLIQKPTNPPTGWTVPWVSTLYASTSLTAANFATNYKSRIGSTNATLVLLSVGLAAGFASSDGTWGNVASDITAEWPFFFVGAASVTATVKGPLGTLADFWMGSAAIATGSAYPAATNDFIQVGSFILPWNGGAINLS